MIWSRYALYWVPDGTLGALGAEWLGWDARRAWSIRMPRVKAPRARRYGFHATLVAPFRLRRDRSEAALRQAARALCGTLDRCAPVVLELGWLGGFCALQPADPSGLATISNAAVGALAGFRVAPTATEMARRRNTELTARQESYLARWGYPFVFEEFRPHLTLSDMGGGEDAVATARKHFAAALHRPQPVGHVSLMGEDPLGRFHVIEDFPLGQTGAVAPCADRSAQIA